MEIVGGIVGTGAEVGEPKGNLLLRENRQRVGIEEGTFKTILDAVGVILIGFGICNNPTDSQNF